MRYLTLHDDKFPGADKERTISFESYGELTWKIPGFLNDCHNFSKVKEPDFFDEDEWTPEEAERVRIEMRRRREQRSMKGAIA